ncbi:DUF4397 domain-containing protein [Chitinophaga filiformis]|uniref:DUF4397 domain-containing protein n=1 Tax=Chitinophaga filiformis TaxID=104663 RepID=A0A1G7IDL8_CHIFI|nr:DUF4397 domain-containing protein [Chitinophaga filiformis]SDF10817.1 protein of unknown function [Chitinophaga filiformis]
MNMTINITRGIFSARIVTILLIAGMLGACNKADYLDVNAGERPPLNAQISFVNARPVDVPLQFWAFTAQVTTTSVGVGKASPYLPTVFGNVQINFTEGTGTSYKLSRQFGNQAAFTASGGPNGPIAGYHHTVFAASSKTDITKDTLILFYDNLETPAAGKAKLRFVHLAPGIPAVSITLQQQGRDSLLFGSVDYGRAGGSVLEGNGLNVWSLGPFVEVPAGTSGLAVSSSSDHSPLAIEGETFSNLALEAGKSYTVFLYKAPGKSATGGAIITHLEN